MVFGVHIAVNWNTPLRCSLSLNMLESAEYMYGNEPRVANEPFFKIMGLALGLESEGLRSFREYFAAIVVASGLLGFRIWVRNCFAWRFWKIGPPETWPPEGKHYNRSSMPTMNPKPCRPYSLNS